MPRIYQQLEQISVDPNAIQVNCKAIAILALWAIRFEISNKPQQPDDQSPSSQLWGQIHTANSASGTVYLDALLSCIKVNHAKMTGGPVLEQAAKVAFLHLLQALAGVDPISTVVQQMHQHSVRATSHNFNFKRLLCYHTINVIQILSVGKQEGHSIGWTVHKPSPQDRTLFTNSLVQVAHEVIENQKKVPRWILRFVLHTLSLNPPPPASVIVNCLLIIAIDLGCDVSITRSVTLDQRYVCVNHVWVSLTKN